MLDLVRAAARHWRDANSRRSILRSQPALAPALSIKSHMKPEELQALHDLAGTSQTALEIGSYLGASACAIAAGFPNHRNGNVLICIDTWNNDAMTEGSIDTFEAFRANTKPYASVIRQVRAWSTQAVPQVSQIIDHIDLLFIDGDHSFEGASADWTCYKPFLRSGSWVVFHDVKWAEGVQKTIRDLVQPHVSEVRTLPNLWWGRIK